MAISILPGRQYCAMMLRWLALLGVIAVLLITTPASANTIENIATARWAEAGRAFETQSNRVSVTVEALTFSLETFRVAPSSAPNMTFIPSGCMTGVSGNTPPDPNSPPQTIGIEPASQFRAGELIVFTISAPPANLDPGATDILRIVVSTSGGARAELIVFEAAPDSGIFVGTLATGRNSPGQISDDCRLNVAAGETITIALPSGPSGSVSLSHDVFVLADPFGMVFDSETGEPVSGARVTLRNASTGAPAQVYAEDGVTEWPSTIISGAPITDGAGNSYAMAPGRYWFPLTALGRYRLEIEPPPAYAAPSAASPAQLAQMSRPDGEAFTISDASFGGDFELASVVPVEVDIPVDRDGAAIDLSLTSLIHGDAVGRFPAQA